MGWPTQTRYKKIDRLIGEIINGVAAAAIMGASIILLTALYNIYHDKIRAAFFAANEFIKPLWGG